MFKFGKSYEIVTGGVPTCKTEGEPGNKVEETQTEETQIEETQIEETQTEETQTEEESETGEDEVELDEYMYVISLDYTPMYYSTNLEDARNKMKKVARSLYSICIDKNRANLYKYYICEPYGDLNSLEVTSNLRMSLFSYENVEHVLNIDRIGKNI